MSIYQPGLTSKMGSDGEAATWNYILVYNIGDIHDFVIAVIAGTPIKIKAHQFKNVSEIKIYVEESI